MIQLAISIWFIVSVTNANFQWSYTGAISGKKCVQWKEPADPNTWHDNYLCSDEDFGIKWSYNGPIDGMRCTKIEESRDPHTWHDNYLCIPPNSELSFRWSSAGPINGLECVQIEEPADPSTWHDNFLCYSFQKLDGLVGIGQSCTLSLGNAETIAAATGVGISIIGELVGLIPVVGPFGSAAIDIAQDPSVDAIEQAIKDGAIICEEGLWCCNSVCRYLQTDWAGIKYCPNECKAGIDCPHGSCGDNRQHRESCDCSGQCSGNMHCCKGECRYLEKDWAGVYYCPHECKAGAFCPHGSCGENKSEYASCSCNEECSGNMACCAGQCRYKQKDWAGIYYCPHECNGGCGWGGTCPSHRSTGQSCGCRLQCNSGCCEGGRCVDKKRDWAGVYYCPAECRGGAFKGPGTC